MNEVPSATRERSFSALLPVRLGVAVYWELLRRAMSAACDANEHRCRGQVMADTLVQRVLIPKPGKPSEPAVKLRRMMTDLGSARFATRTSRPEGSRRSPD